MTLRIRRGGDTVLRRTLRLRTSGRKSATVMVPHSGTYTLSIEARTTGSVDRDRVRLFVGWT